MHFRSNSFESLPLPLSIIKTGGSITMDNFLKQSPLPTKSRQLHNYAICAFWHEGRTLNEASPQSYKHSKALGKEFLKRFTAHPKLRQCTVKPQPPLKARIKKGGQRT